MKSVQETIERSAKAELLEATVERQGAELCLRIGARMEAAKVAPSCLLCPEVGDRVLVSQSRRGAAIIAVVERGAGTARIMIAEGQPFRLTGERIDIDAQRIAVQASETLRLDAARTTICSRSLQVVADAMTTAAGAVRSVAETVDAVADRMTEYVGRRFRRVDREHVEVGDLTTRCTGIHETSGEAVVVVGRRVTKIDGGQIQVG